MSNQMNDLRRKERLWEIPTNNGRHSFLHQVTTSSSMSGKYCPPFKNARKAYRQRSICTDSAEKRWRNQKV